MDEMPTFQPRLSSGRPADVGAAVADALSVLDPAPSDPLTLIVNDPQRHTATRSVLETVCRHVAPARIRILVATGTHHFPDALRRDFARRLCDPPAVREFAWHDCDSPDLRDVAHWRGHPWLTDESGRGRLLAIGSVEPHYFAGFTGAHKTCTIGCASREAVESNHARALLPDCRPGRIEGNPLCGDVLWMVATLENRASVAAVNLVQAGDHIVAATGGTVRDALDAAIGPAGECFLHTIDAPLDAVVAEVTGPLGRSFYQADKGIKNNEWAVRDGGVIVLVAPCPDGIGQDHFVSLLREARSHDEAVRIVRRRGYRLGDHKAVRLRYLTDPACRGVRVYAVSAGLTDADADVLGLGRADSVPAALADAGIDPTAHAICRVRDAGNCCVLPARN